MPKRSRAAAKSSQAAAPLPTVAAWSNHCDAVKQYVESWAVRSSGDAQPWKFNKRLQTWLLLNLYDPAAVPDALFDAALEYLTGLSGQAAEATKATATAIREKQDMPESERDKILTKLRAAAAPKPAQPAAEGAGDAPAPEVTTPDEDAEPAGAATADAAAAASADGAEEDASPDASLASAISALATAGPLHSDKQRQKLARKRAKALLKRLS